MDVTGWIVAVVALACAAILAFRLRTASTRLQQLELQLQRDTSAERALAASDERARIARDMHDVVAHTLSVVVAQADGGRFAAASDPDASVRTLSTIAEVGRGALGEMRALLGVLRDSDADVAMGPQPSLDDIPGLVASIRDGGLDVSYVTTGTPRPLPIGVALAFYRIAQEALTNVLKHAGPAVRAYVQLQWEPNAVSLTISDDGRGAAAHHDGGGSGIEGMRERATIFGGSLSAGPQAGGGFLVRARLPLAPSIGATDIQPDSPEEPS